MPIRKFEEVAAVQRGHVGHVSHVLVKRSVGQVMDYLRGEREIKSTDKILRPAGFEL